MNCKNLSTAALAFTLTTLASAAHAEMLLGLTTDQKLLTLDSTAPANGSLMSISGLMAGERIKAIDMRPTTGVVYGLSDMGNLYQINASTGMASGRKMLSMPVQGTAVGLDFNPAADLSNAAAGSLRLTSNARENWVINVATGAVTVQTALPTGFKVAASAYTNNDTNPATATVLYNIDTGTDSLYKQNPPAAGTQELVGALGMDTSGIAGFDISAAGMGYAALTDADTGQSTLYRVALSGTGPLATSLGSFGVGGNTAAVGSVIGLTAMTPAVPEPSSIAMVLGGLALVPWLMRRRTS
jgi:Domain of unknown function (DUF4394)